MYDKAMQELNIKLWEREHKRCQEEEERLKKIMDDDPTTMLIDCNLAFAKLLDDNKGDKRSTPQFKAELAKLARKEKRAKLLSEGFDIVVAMDNYHAAKIQTGQVATALSNFQFSYKLHWERSKKKRREIEAEEVKKIVDEVSK
jgi:fructosamine-3-kinase